MKVMVCGTGQFLYHVTYSLLSKGYYLTLISPDKDECVNLAREYKTAVIHGDATKEKVLAAAGIDENDILITMLPNDEDNYIVALQALRRVQTLRAVALVNNPLNVDFFKKIGVHVLLSVPNIISSLVEGGINEAIINLQPLEDGQVNSMVITVENSSPINGRKFEDLPLITEGKVAALLRNGCIVAEPQIVAPGDKLLILVPPAFQGRVIRDYTGQR